MARGRSRHACVRDQVADESQFVTWCRIQDTASSTAPATIAFATVMPPTTPCAQPPPTSPEYRMPETITASSSIHPTRDARRPRMPSRRQTGTRRYEVLTSKSSRVPWSSRETHQQERTPKWSRRQQHPRCMTSARHPPSLGDASDHVAAAAGYPVASHPAGNWRAQSRFGSRVLATSRRPVRVAALRPLPYRPTTGAPQARR